MRRILERIFDTSRYSNQIDVERARMIYGMGVLMLAMLLGFNLFATNAEGQRYVLTLGSIGGYLLIFSLPTIASLILARTGRLRPASMALITAWVLLSAG